MAYTTINKPSDYFNTKLYTGTGSSNAITGVGFQPDLIWSKNRGSVTNHFLVDVIRGTEEELRTNSTNHSAGDSALMDSIDSDGFTLGTSASMNTSSANYVSWNWKANGAGSSNTDGSITSTVSANTTSGFSVVTYAGNSTAGATIGHGLNAVPSMVIVKSTSNAESWAVYHKSVTTANNYYLYLNSTGALVTSGGDRWSVGSNSSTLFGLGNDGTTNSSGQNYVAYCFAEKKGFSKFGSYTGNASTTDNAFIYCGFKPAFFLTKCSSFSGDRWALYDNKRDTYNPVYRRLFPDGDIAESANIDVDIDFTSTGVKIRTDAGTTGASQTYIYMAFAEHPLVSSTGTPCTAR